jgi:hypothetical protein
VVDGLRGNEADGVLLRRSITNPREACRQPGEIIVGDRARSDEVVVVRTSAVCRHGVRQCPIETEHSVLVANAAIDIDGTAIASAR